MAAQVRTDWQEISKLKILPAPVAEAVPVDYDRNKLSLVCKYGDLKALVSLLAQGMDIHQENDPTLRWAAQNGQTEMVRFLIDNGANIFAYGDWALQQAAHNGHIETVRLLIESGANIFAENCLAMRRAAEKGYTDIVALMVERGAPIEKITPEQRQAYYLRQEQTAMVLQKNAQIDKNLTEIFQAGIWVGHVAELQRLWQEMPEPLQDRLDFQHILSTAKILTNKRHKPKITLVR
jgi:hypothetical protein